MQNKKENWHFLVTGHKGFIGHKAVELVKYNNIKCSFYDPKDHGGEPDINIVYDIIKKNKITHVMHFGALSSTTEKDMDKVLRYNYDFTRDLIDICFDNENINLQLSSSASLYGKTDKPSKESDVLNPQSPYAISKYLMERYALQMIQDNNANIQIFRYFNVFSYAGEYMKDFSQCSPHYRFGQQLRNCDYPVILFNGSENILRDFVDVNYVIDTQFRFLCRYNKGVFNIGSGTTKSFKDILNEMVSFSTWKHDIEKNIKYIDIPENIKDHYQYYTCADMTKTWGILSGKIHTDNGLL